ncbi:ABC transporter substrate-binding protein [Aliivibrio finisterrensis]|uniref:substrate-binding domain-containing protein n=1 Tax=Aliivibrio finisterrensis TaxID=511998 RepID=UPI00101F0A28|nr:substrate-binding domain-containing protein [Aliivibrio finisterrensis]RYU68467.1 ABC transporter substrate-binding protein [Aliivibrio finisterrensis]RYU72220.1 ABC transporter substrate-binding protein [Aliivibrio finisterrensis]
MVTFKAKYCSLLLVLATFLSYSKSVFSDPILVGYWGYNEYLTKYPKEKALTLSLADTVKEAPIPLSVQQDKPVNISFIYPGEQASDYWKRNLIAFEARLQALNIDYELTPVSTRLNVDFKEQSCSLYNAIEKKSDYLIFTLSTTRHRKFIEHVLQNPETKIILQNITTPVKAWHDTQPLLYAGFDHVIGTRLLAKYFQTKFPNGAKYGMLYYSYGYLSTARGDVFVQSMDNNKYTLTSSFYTDTTEESAYKATKNIVNDNPDIDFIYASSTDIALGALDALDENMNVQPVLNGWGGGSLELIAIEQGKLDATVMRMNDDIGIAMAEAIKLDLEGKQVPTVYSGDFEMVTSETNTEELEKLKQRAFRYSGVDFKHE